MAEQEKYAPDSGLIHNMSAPPRLAITIQTLSTCRQDSGSPDDSDVLQGFREILSLDVDGFIEKYFSDYVINCSSEGGPNGPAWRDYEAKAERILNSRHLRLRCLVVLSRLATDKVEWVCRKDVLQLTKASKDELMDEYLANTALLDPIAMGYPAFGLVHRPVKAEAGNWITAAQGLAIISRVSGDIFLGAHAPFLHDFEASGRMQFLLTVPVHRGGKEL
jgi:hypothetical protein